MKNKIFGMHLLAIALVLISALEATAQSKPKSKPASQKANQNPAVSQPAIQTPPKTDSSHISLGVGASLGLLYSNVGFGGSVHAVFHRYIDLPVDFGIMSGIYSYGARGGTSSITSTLSFPVLALAVYNLDFLDMGDFKPYAAAAVGVSFITEKSSTAFAGGSTSRSSTEFQALGIFGTHYLDFYAEIPLGFMGSDFLAHVTVGYRFKF
jgi:hypothetical protein